MISDPQKITGNYFHKELKDCAKSKPQPTCGEIRFSRVNLWQVIMKKIFFNIHNFSNVWTTFKLLQGKEERVGGMCTHTMFLLPWGSLVAMEFSDPETKPSPNQLANIHMHTSEWLITEANSTFQREFPSLMLTQTVKSSKSSINIVFSTRHCIKLMLC